MLFIQNDATGAGTGNLDPNQAAVDLAIITNGDTGLGFAAQVGDRQQVTYTRSLPGTPLVRLDNLVNTNYSPNYGGGPQNVNIVILPVKDNFFLNDGSSILNWGGVSLPPQGSGLVGDALNNTNDCLIIYDTTQNQGQGYCVTRQGSGGIIDLPTSNPVILYHELSHAFRIVTNAQLATTLVCNPSSPEESAAITDENDLRTQIANANGTAVVLRDPGIYCGALCQGVINCCIIASVASGSPLSEEVATLRSLRDSLLRKGDVGFTFFQSLLRDYYGFSPQVCTLMAEHPDLRPLVLEGLVRPLISILSLIRSYALDNEHTETLGERFVAEHSDRALASVRLDLLRRASEVINGIEVDLTNTERQLTDLLLPAIISEYIVWGLIEPIRIYQSTLQAYIDGKDSNSLGDGLYQGITSWSGKLPLDDIWASLSLSEIRSELKTLDSFLLRTPVTRSSFRNRLRSKFGDITAVVAALNEEEEWKNG
jgi:hypothetical protein